MPHPFSTLFDYARLVIGDYNKLEILINNEQKHKKMRNGSSSTDFGTPVITEYPIVNGIYKHYKGGTYKVLFLSEHTETGEVLVNIRSIEFGKFYSRPLSKWSEIISQEQSKTTYRYVFVKSEPTMPTE